MICWIPILLACGIALYFSLPFEPSQHHLILVALSIVALTILSIKGRGLWAIIFAVFALNAAGFLIAATKAHLSAAPKLHYRYYGPISGQLVAIDRSNSDAPRLTLEHVILKNTPPERTPKRVRVSLHGMQAITQFSPGDVIITTGHLSPPSGPAEPSGYDFQRHAWFSELGAVGYTRTPALRFATHQGHGFKARLFSLRMTLSRIITSALPNQAGAFAAALITGDRSNISQEDLKALRTSNLAHLLAISGLHMGLLTAFIFTAVRCSLALCPHIALHWPVKKIAASLAICAGLFYLLLSGGNIATQRAFIMVAVMFSAILLNRKALSLRAVSIAAILILILYPSSLLGPGFQMSFSATIALIVIFRALQNIRIFQSHRILSALASVVLSSLIAGLATAPYSAAHFNQVSYLSLPANMASVPLMGILIIPAAVLSVIAMPFGLEWIPLSVMSWGLDWTLGVAHTIAATPGAVGHVPSPAPSTLPLLSLGALWFILWNGKGRWVGLIAITLGFLLWSQAQRPQLLISDRGTLLGLMTRDGRALSKPKGDGFVAQVWLENDGKPTPQDRAATRKGFTKEGRLTRTQIGTYNILAVSGKTALKTLKGCGNADVLISNQSSDIVFEHERPCQVFTATTLRHSGALALDISAKTGELKIKSAAAQTGKRLWNTKRLTKIK